MQSSPHFIREKIKKICGYQPVFHPVALSDESRVGSFAVDVSVAALFHAVRPQQIQDIRTLIKLIERRIVEKDKLFGLSGGVQGRFEAPHLPAEDLFICSEPVSSS